jgi:hypothetical protein
VTLKLSRHVQLRRAFFRPPSLIVSNTYKLLFIVVVVCFSSFTRLEEKHALRGNPQSCGNPEESVFFFSLYLFVTWLQGLSFFLFFLNLVFALASPQKPVCVYNDKRLHIVFSSVFFTLNRASS